jgi:hypothetical protein
LNAQKPFLIGIFLSVCGLFLFNLGLLYGFTKLSDEAGSLLPAAYIKVAYEPKSPHYGYAGGIAIVCFVVFMLGFLATRAEPALNILGKTVENLSKGHFSKSMLIYSVSIGVGTGMVIGSTKILFNIPLVYLIFVKYFISLVLTFFTPEDFTNIAWDSAGVTTGPVTVPFVLSLGIGFKNATRADEGFGILTAASAAPIIAVLLSKLVFNPALKKAAAVKRMVSDSIRKRTGSTSSIAS